MNISEQDGNVVIQMSGYLSVDVLDQIKKSLANVSQYGAKDYLLDMKQVTHLFSAAIGLITHLHKQIADVGGRLFIVNVNDEVEKTLCTVNLDRAIRVFKTTLDFEIGKDIPEDLGI